ncbi:glycosyltransferase family 4 protein [Candidatus Woesearchaeota archaeon]|nr:glycosyltransferase family 4 protein [Candidatus Woesearchaeota archaeon]
MKVLMFGWEFAPIYSGGLGVACAGLVKALVQKGAEVTFVLPKLPKDISEDKLSLVAADLYRGKVKVKVVKSLLVPYSTTTQYSAAYAKFKNRSPGASLYGADLFEEVARYSEAAKAIAKEVQHDVIHCHDWMTYQAGIAAKSVSGKPLIVHVHATEHDRSPGSINFAVEHIEKRGFEQADKVVTVSQYTKDVVKGKYGINDKKITVVHNAIDAQQTPSRLPAKSRVVLFLGRITRQKGPDYFLHAAKHVIAKEPNALFIVAGSGDMQPQIIEQAANMGIADKVLFTGFLTGADIDKAYRMASVFVMPSVSEPFGLTALEAMANGTPTIISKQSGVSEVVKHCLKVDFWDTQEMANKILGVLYYQDLQQELGLNGQSEIKQFTWKKPAEHMLGLYKDVMKVRRR